MKGQGYGVQRDVQKYFYRDAHTYQWRKPKYTEKTTNLPQVTDSHNVVSSTLRLNEFRLTTFVVIGIYCIGSCKSNYHAITTMTTPLTSVVLYQDYESLTQSNIVQYFNYIIMFMAVCLVGERNWTTDLLQITDKLNHILLYKLHLTIGCDRQALIDKSREPHG